MLLAMSTKETISPMALPPWSSGGQFHFLQNSGFCGSFSKTSILFLGINSKEVVENTGERLLLLGTASGMNADVSTIRPGWSNEDGPDDFSETGSRGWPQGCCDDALHSVYDIIAISLVAFHSCLLSVFSSSEGALIASSAHQKDIIVIPALPCAFSLQDADLDQPHWLHSLDRVHSSSPWQQFVVLLV